VAIFTARFRQAVWVKGHYGEGEWHHAPFMGNQRYLTCGKPTPNAREVKPLSRVYPTPTCSECKKALKEDRKMRTRNRQRTSASKSPSLDGTEGYSHFAREEGKFGSHPGFDAMDDEARP
jgi:hypothetical protein